MYKKSGEKNTEYVKVLLKPSEKDRVQDLSETLGISMGTVMRIAFNNFENRIQTNDGLIPSEKLTRAYEESLNPKNVKSVEISSGEDLLDELDD